MKRTLVQPYLHFEEGDFFALGARGKMASTVREAIRYPKGIEFGDVTVGGKGENVSGFSCDPFLYLCLWRFEDTSMLYIEGLDKESAMRRTPEVMRDIRFIPYPLGNAPRDRHLEEIASAFADHNYWLWLENRMSAEQRGLDPKILHAARAYSGFLHAHGVPGEEADRRAEERFNIDL